MDEEVDQATGDKEKEIKRQTKLGKLTVNDGEQDRQEWERAYNRCGKVQMAIQALLNKMMAKWEELMVKTLNSLPWWEKKKIETIEKPKMERGRSKGDTENREGRETEKEEIWSLIEGH